MSIKQALLFHKKWLISKRIDKLLLVMKNEKNKVDYFIIREEWDLVKHYSSYASSTMKALRKLNSLLGDNE